MILGILNLIVMVGGIILMGLYAAKSMKLKVYMPQDNQPPYKSRLSKEKADEFRLAYERLFQNMNIRTCMSVMTDMFLNDNVKKLRIYNKMGIKCVISFIPAEENERDESLTTFEAGKYVATNEQAIGVYVEQFFDASTNQLLWQKRWDKSRLNLKLIRNPEAKKNQAILCYGCGSPVELQGEVHVCPNCGAKVAGKFCSNCGNKCE